MFKKITTCITLTIAFITLLSLGFWQLDRLEWKTEIITSIENYATIDPVTTGLNIEDEKDFQRGFIRGEYLNTHPILVGPRTSNGQNGHHLYQAFRTLEGIDLMINRGWVSSDEKLVISVPPGQTVIAGYLKSSDEKNTFTPPNAPDQNMWYHADINDLNAFLNLNLHSKILYQEYPATESPKIFSDLPTLRNNHFQYAIFWFFMAGLLPFLCMISYFKRPRY